ncbi:MAG: RNA methyltransferase [Actinomycetaceae bacterium]|nr:RNA methyltransferase [Actinomycetaceae bacterium]
MERREKLINPRAERVKRVAGLSRRSVRADSGLLRFEGPQAVSELVRLGAGAVRDLYMTPEQIERYPNLWDAARAKDIWSHEVSPEVARSMAEGAQGIIAVADASVVSTEMPVLASDTPALIMVLPETQDPGNAGTLVRIADGAGARAVVSCSGTVDLLSPKVVRSSVGSVLHLALPRVESFEQAILDLQSQGFTCVGADGYAPTTLQEFSAALQAGTYGRKIAWVMGNEARGLTQAEGDSLDLLVSIRLYGQAESLNVASAASLCLFATADVLWGSL